MITALKFIVPILLIWIALNLACALRVGRRRRTGSHQVAADPYFHPFGEMPIVPQERLLIASDFRAWGVPVTFQYGKPCKARKIDLVELSDGALRRNENGGRSPVSKSLSSGPAVVLNFRKVQP